MDGAQAYFGMPAFPGGPWPRQDTVVLATLASSVPRARRHAREMLWEWKLDFLAEDAEVIVSELASNAVRATAASDAGAADRSVALQLLGDPSRLLILVRDPLPWPPVAPEAAPGAADESGRGLLLVTALATRWHWYHPPRAHGGKVVWALLDAAERTLMHTCTCGYEAAEAEELGDHLAEMFTPTDDRDARGITHAEVARDRSAPPAYTCLCGHAAGERAALDAHLLGAFTPASGIGHDGLAHAATATLPATA